MKTEKLLKALGDISDEMILDAAPGQKYGAEEHPVEASYVREQQAKRTNKRRIRWAAVAAAFICIIGAGLVLGDRILPHAGSAAPDGKNIVADGAMNTSVPSDTAEVDKEADNKYNGLQTPVDETLPKLAISPVVDGMGFGVTLYKKGTSPEVYQPAFEVPETFAAYKNNSFSPAGTPYGLNEEQMMQLLDDAAEKLGISAAEPQKVFDHDNEIDKKNDILTRIYITEDDLKLTVAANAEIVILKQDGTLSEEEISPFVEYDGASTETALSYSYSKLEPVYPGSNMYVGVGPYRLRRGWKRIWNTSNDLSLVQERLINAGNDILQPQNLYITNGAMVSSKVADYPSISCETALKMLEAGKFVKGTGVDVFPGRESIISWDIRYEVSCTLEYFLPFYHFWVKLPEEAAKPYGEEAEKTMDAYAEFYVPAIDERYFVSNLWWN